GARTDDRRLAEALDVAPHRHDEPDQDVGKRRLPEVGEEREEAEEQVHDADRGGDVADSRIAVGESGDDAQVTPRHPEEEQVEPEGEDAALRRGPQIGVVRRAEERVVVDLPGHLAEVAETDPDRKSTRLNSSHLGISY